MGMGITGGTFHALLWSGSAASCVDLNPSGFTRSEAYDTSDTLQVGFGYGTATGGATHALLWSGSADSYVDLHSLLPSSFLDSYAYCIDGSAIYGIGVDQNGSNHAIEWTIVPEPGSFGLVGLAMLAWAGRRRKRVGKMI